MAIISALVYSYRFGLSLNVEINVILNIFKLDLYYPEYTILK